MTAQRTWTSTLGGGHAAGLETEAEPLDDVDVVEYHIRDQRRLKPLIARADVIFAQPPWPVLGAWLRNSGARLIYDLYDPEPLEVLESLSHRSMRLRRVLDTLTVDRVVDALHDGHHLVCASEKPSTFETTRPRRDEPVLLRCGPNSPARIAFPAASRSTGSEKQTFQCSGVGGGSGIGG